ncbi:gene transfer agent family protein [Devosia beringensis]|uniref:gene transfer agent family protein n=1 Tax=Devosia beringensis TaxID=2657486 RepID=UPI00186BADAA|nr:gene transfer agent family protein [Devosia beringensis]
MSRDASIGPLPWADGKFTFRLGWGELALLQEKTDCGPLALLDRLGGRQWRIEDISHSIRLALIGGGTPPAEALKLVEAYVEKRPPLENHMLAWAIVSAGVQGAPDEPLKKPQGRAKAKSSTTSPTESGGSA